jgi:hypothetical protein
MVQIMLILNSNNLVLNQKQNKIKNHHKQSKIA